MDPAKLKVVELRAELASRGLDTKGNKPVLVRRLKEALEAELETEIADTSIADTSTEDAASQGDVSEAHIPEPEMRQPEVPTMQEPMVPTLEPEVPMEDPLQVPSPEPEPVQVPIEEPAVSRETEMTKLPESSESEQSIEESAGVQEQEVPVQEEKPMEEDKPLEEVKEPLKEPIVEKDLNKEEEPKVIPTIDETRKQNDENRNGENTEVEENVENKNRKSRWTDSTETADVEMTTEKPAVAIEQQPSSEKKEEDEDWIEEEPLSGARGEKRKHSRSPDRGSQRKCSRSPVREDEPVVDSNQVRLSWYDSDLHLLIDKTNFLSAKPLNEGLFSYVWSGARFTHGVPCKISDNEGENVASSAHRVCFDVRITDELKFDNFLNVPSSRRSNGRDRKDRNGKEESRDRSISKSKEDSIVDANADQTKKKEGDESKDAKDEDVAKSDDAEMAEAKEDGAEKPQVAEEPTSKPAEEQESTKDVEKPVEKEDEKMEEDSTVEKSETEKTSPGEEQKSKDDVPEKDTLEGESSSTEDRSQKVPAHLIRIGWSSSKSSLQLGEDINSFALESTGKFFHNKTIVETDAKYGKGDVVRAYLDTENHEMAFAVNGTLVYTHKFDLPESNAFTLFPHVLTRNYAFEVNPGGVSEDSWCEHAENYGEFKFIATLDEKVPGVPSAKTREECEVIVMVGLPGAGKTFWVNDYLKSNDTPYYVIGNSFLAKRLTVDGEPLEQNICADRVNQYYDKLGKSVNRLCELASLRRRNFILDQTNVFPTAIRRKMRSFVGFKRHAVVIVNEDEEQTKRMKQQESETGKGTPDSAVLEMKADMGLPKVGDIVETVTYGSLQEEAAKSQVQKYNGEGKAAGFGNIGYNRRDHRDNRSHSNSNWNWNRGRRDSRGNRDRFYDNRYQNTHRQQPRYNRPQWTPRNQDKRDNRGRDNRDWRNRVQDRSSRVSRDYRSHGGSSGSSGGGGGGSGGSSYRHRSNTGGSGGGGSGNRNWSGSQQPGSWSNPSGGSGGGSWGGSGGGGGSQNHDNYTSGWNQSQGSWNQNQWKYGGYGGQGGYAQYPNWNYYGQYGGGGGGGGQDWNTGTSQAGRSAGGQQQQQRQQAAGGGSSVVSDGINQQLSHLTSQEQAMWALYAQRYNQNTTNTTTTTTQNSSSADTN